MAYKGIIKKSKTYDVLVLFTIMTAVQPLLMDTLTQFALSQKWISLTNLIFIGWMAWVRTRTTGAVGTEGPPNDVERRGK